MHGIKTREPSGARLNREKWHKPLISVIVTHYNYSGHVRDAILSILDQTHENWECVIVDDASDAAHRDALKTIVDEINDRRVTILPLDENGGQVPSFFAGLGQTTGDFVCLLDPDDRYAETFLEEALAIHLGAGVMCPILSTDQYLITERGVIGAGLRAEFHIAAMRQQGKFLEVCESEKPRLLYIPAKTRGWHWTSTSAMMFRRAALNYLKPSKKLAYRGCADGYLAQGMHRLGGTLFLQKALVYRTLHASNAWISSDIYASSQDKQREGAQQWSPQALLDAIESIRANGLPNFEREPEKSQEQPREKAPEKPQANPQVTKAPGNNEIQGRRGVGRHLDRWQRSIRKRIA